MTLRIDKGQVWAMIRRQLVREEARDGQAIERYMMGNDKYLDAMARRIADAVASGCVKDYSDEAQREATVAT
jgi:hypothetical protein